MVCDPLTVRDCCLLTDGAGAFVLVRADRARDLPHPPAYVLGSCHGRVASADFLHGRPDRHGGARSPGLRALRMAGMSPADVDLLCLYDAFTINTLLFLEDLGFCPKGEGGRFVADGAHRARAASCRSTPTAAAYRSAIRACTAFSW